MKIQFTNPATNIDYIPDLKPMVNDYSHVAVGGPEEASVSIRGLADDLIDMTKRLGYRVTIRNDNAIPVWWGFLFSVEARFGERRVNASLGRMANKVAVAYSKLNPGQVTSDERSTTGWVSDAFSISRYGTKEQLITKADLTEEAAEAARDLALSKQRLPRREVATGISEGGSLSGLLRCKGEFNRLSWELFPQEEGQVSHEESGLGTQGIGTTTIAKVAQSFQITSTDPWYVEMLTIRARKQGNPVDNCIVTIHANSAGVPGTQLAIATIPAASFAYNTLQWMEGFVSARYELQPSTTYWLQIARSGAPSAGDYYLIDVDESLGFAGGALKLYTSSWINRSPDADMLFKIGGTRETTVQMADMLDTIGQFITGYTIVSPSGVFTNPFRDGRTDGLYTIRELLKLGSTNGVRYLAKVDLARHLWVYEEPTPDPSVPDYTVDEFDIWSDKGGGKVPKNLCPVGGWYRIDSMPEAYASAEVLDTGLYFMERSTYRPKSDRLVVDPPDSVETSEEVEFI